MKKRHVVAETAYLMNTFGQSLTFQINVVVLIVVIYDYNFNKAVAFCAESAKYCQESIFTDPLRRTLHCSVSVTFKLLSFKYSSCVFKVGLVKYKI